MYRGRAIAVEHGIPGETARVKISGRRRLRGHIVKVVEAAPDRVEPPCPYFREWQCGGCQWQHISYDGQVERKRRSVEEEIQQAGLPFLVTAVHTLEVPWRYRSTAGISLGRHAGFRRHGSLTIVPIRDCPISHPLIGRLMASLNEAIETRAIPDFRGRVRLEVGLANFSEGKGLLALIQPSPEGKMPDEESLARLTRVLSAMDDVRGISMMSEENKILAVSGESFAPTEVAGRRVWLASGSFFQTNILLLPELIARLLEESEPRRGRRIADIYAGVGIFGLFLAEGAEKVDVIESDPRAVEASRLTATEWGLSNVRFHAERAERGLVGAGQYDIVVLDPPRAGLSEPVLEQLVLGRPSCILYVSCLARSLARDLGVLTAAGYGLEHLELFDFYPQTYHVELLAVLRIS